MKSTNRYSQSPSLTSTNFLVRSQNLPRSTHSSLQKVPALLTPEPSPLLVLPNLHMRKSISTFTTVTTQRNTRNQLHSISNKIQQLENDVSNARIDALQTSNQMRALRQQLIQGNLKMKNDELLKSINGLRKNFNLVKQMHENRSEELRQEYIRLWNQTEQMRQWVFEIKTRIEKIDQAMGLRNL